MKKEATTRGYSNKWTFIAEWTAWAVVILVFLGFSLARAEDYTQVAGLIDLRTTFSDGELDPDTLVGLAKERGFRVVVLNDHDRMVMEYGLPPLRNIIRKRVERNSINKQGPEHYLNTVRRAQRSYPGMVVIPGSESAPFYYWTGSYFQNNLTAHNHERRILTVGLDQPEDYEDLPVLHNGFSVRYIENSLPAIVVFVVPFVLGIFLIRHKGSSRIWGIFISGFSLICIINADPFRSSPFDQYHGDQGIAPYQLLIDYVDSKGGLTFWNYPETRSGVKKMGPISVHTPPHPQVLLQSEGYTGFAALYGDRITITEPGNIWDNILLEYARGERDQPAWGISTADFHKEGGAGEILGNFSTVFLVKKSTRREILSAMKQGRMYACRSKYPQRIIMKEFSISSPNRKVKAVSGGHMKLDHAPVIHISLSLKRPDDRPIKVRLIRSGKLIQTFYGPLPMDIEYRDEYYARGEKIYYRIDARGNCGTLVSNPIFVTFK